MKLAYNNNRNYYPSARSRNRSHLKGYSNKKYDKKRDVHYRQRSRERHSKLKRYQKSYSISSSSESYSKSYSQSNSRSNQCSSSSGSSYSSSSQSVQIITSGSTQKRRNAPHYHYKKGQKIGYKYKVFQKLGDGTFGRVVRGQYENKAYAIKIIKPVMKYIKSAKIQKDIVKIINQKDPQDKYGIVRYIQSFEHRRHYCIVFKQLGLSLYHLIKKNNYKGFSKKQVKQFFHQILTSVKFLHKLGYTHTDLKPQNILLQDKNLIKKTQYLGCSKYYIPESNQIRLIDFGSATHESQHHSSIINTRQYRSPQVILQCCQWNQLSDVWSIGCIIIELFTGELFFDTHQDYQHLTMIQKNCGKFPKWMVSQSKNGLHQVISKNGWIKEKKIKKYIGQGQNVVYMKTVNQIFSNDQILADLLMKCLTIDPKLRISCQQALNHPYFLQKQ